MKKEENNTYKLLSKKISGRTDELAPQVKTQFYWYSNIGIQL